MTETAEALDKAKENLQKRAKAPSYTVFVNTGSENDFRLLRQGVKASSRKEAIKAVSADSGTFLVIADKEYQPMSARPRRRPSTPSSSRALHRGPSTPSPRAVPRSRTTYKEGGRRCNGSARDPWRNPMSAVNCSAPTRVEVDAAEKVLADAHSQPADGYWRTLAEDALQAAKDAQLREFIAIVDREFDAALGEGRR